MENKLFLNTVRFITLLLFQVLILNHIRLSNFINPYIYVLFVLMMPLNISGWFLLFLGFFTGLSIDLFVGTPGLHAGATVFMAFMRPTIIRILSSGKDLEKIIDPSINAMGSTWFLFYSFILVFMHHTMLFLLEAFSINQLGDTLLRIIASVPISEIFILLIAYFFRSKKKS